MLRKLGIIFSVILCALAAALPAFAQAPPPVPALPDTERRTAYTITAQTGPFDLNFAVYGDGTDYGNWIEVWLNGVKLTPVTQWTLSTTTGSLSTLARPITNARVTLVTASTGTLQIVGDRRPRRIAQFAENRGVAARDLNQALTDIIAQNRETWDLRTRSILSEPGFAFNQLPVAASRASKFPCFDATGQLTVCAGSPGTASIAAGSGIAFSGSNPTTIALNPTGPFTWTGDQYFRSGRPWVDVRAYGAVGDNATDDSAAINAAGAAAAALGGGIVYFPPGSYCAFSTIYNSTASSIIYQGAGANASGVSACAHDINLFRINSRASSIRDLIIVGKGNAGEGGTFGATQPVILVDSSCIECLLDNLYVVGGAPTIKVTSGEAHIYRTFASLSYGAAILHVNGGGGWLNRLKLDQSWPVSVPTSGATANAWQAAHAYVVGEVVSTGGYYIQASVAGTSAGSAPTLKNYFVNITDGGVTWLLVGPTSYNALRMDGGGIELYAAQIDMTGSFSAGLYLNPAANAYFRCSDCIASQALDNGAQIYSGNVFLTNPIFASAFRTNGTNGSAVYIDTGYTGSFTTTGGQYAGGIGIDLYNTGGGAANISNTSFTGISVAGVRTAGNVNNLNVIGNFFGNSSGIGAQVRPGTSDHYNIIANVCTNAASCVSDSGTGTHKSVTTLEANYIASGFIQTGAVTVASLQACNAAAKGARHFVTDANATFTAGIGAVVAAGGANNVPVVCDGTNWRIG